MSACVCNEKYIFSEFLELLKSFESFWKIIVSIILWKLIKGLRRTIYNNSSTVKKEVLIFWDNFCKGDFLEFALHFAIKLILYYLVEFKKKKKINKEVF